MAPQGDHQPGDLGAATAIRRESTTDASAAFAQIVESEPRAPWFSLRSRGLLVGMTAVLIVVAAVALVVRPGPDASIETSDEVEAIDPSTTTTTTTSTTTTTPPTRPASPVDVRTVDWTAVLRSTEGIVADGPEASIGVRMPAEPGPWIAVGSRQGWSAPAEASYGDLDEDGHDDAVITIYSGGTRGNSGALVFVAAPGAPRLVGRLSFYSEQMPEERRYDVVGGAVRAENASATTIIDIVDGELEVISSATPVQATDCDAATAGDRLADDPRLTAAANATRQALFAAALTGDAAALESLYPARDLRLSSLPSGTTWPEKFAFRPGIGVEIARSLCEGARSGRLGWMFPSWNERQWSDLSGLERTQISERASRTTPPLDVDQQASLSPDTNEFFMEVGAFGVAIDDAGVVTELWTWWD